MHIADSMTESDQDRAERIIAQMAALLKELEPIPPEGDEDFTFDFLIDGVTQELPRLKQPDAVCFGFGHALFGQEVIPTFQLTNAPTSVDEEGVGGELRYCFQTVGAVMAAPTGAQAILAALGIAAHRLYGKQAKPAEGDA